MKRVNIVHTELVKEGSVLYGKESRVLKDTKDAATFAASFFRGKDHEEVYVLALDKKSMPIAIAQVASGGMAYAQVDLPMVFRAAILAGASFVMVFHNHPSGDSTPSKEDYEMTKRIQKAGELMDIQLLDHIVLGDNGSYSSAMEEAKEKEWKNAITKTKTA